MSSTIGSLLVEISANVAKFSSDMDRVSSIAEAKMQQIDKSVGLVKNSLIGLGVSFAAFTSLETLKEKIMGVVDSAAELQHLSEKTGTAAAQLSGLVAVAKLTNTSTDELATGLQKLSKSMIDAESGGKKTSAAFQAIGIDVNTLKTLKPDEAFQLIAKRLDEYDNGAGKVAVTQALLGKSGANLLPVLKELAETGDLQVKVTNQQAAAAEEYEKNVKRLQATSQAMVKTIGLEMIPVLDDVTKAMLESQKQAGGLKDYVKSLADDHSIRDWAQSAAIGFAYFAESVQVLYKGILALGGSLSVMYNDMRVAGTFVKNGAVAGLLFKGNREELAAVVEERNKVLDSANKRYDDLWNKPATTFSDSLKKRFAEGNSNKWAGMSNPYGSSKETLGAFGEGGGGKEQISDGEKLLKTLMDRIYATQKLSAEQQILLDISRGQIVFDSKAQQASAIAAAKQLDAIKAKEEADKREQQFSEDQITLNNKIQSGVTKYIESQKKKAESFIELIDPAEKYRKQLEEIDSLEAGYLTNDQRTQARGKILAEQFMAVNGTAGELKKADDATKQLGNSFTSAFENAILSGNKLSDVLKGLLQDIARIVLRQQISGPIADWASMLFGGQASRNGYVTGGLSQGSVWSGMDGIGSDITKSAPKLGTVIQYNTFGSDVNHTTLAAFGQQLKANTLAAVREQAKR